MMRDKFLELKKVGWQRGGRVSVPGRAAEAGRPKGRPYNGRRCWLVVKCYCILGLHVFYLVSNIAGCRRRHDQTVPAPGGVCI